MAVVPELKERVRRLFYPAYESRMVRALPNDRIPRHIGVMLDGNRRWAKGVGHDSTHGYRAGALLTRNVTESISQIRLTTEKPLSERVRELPVGVPFDYQSLECLEMLCIEPP